MPRALSSSTHLDDVARGDRDVLRARAAVVLQVLVDLRLALALGRLVERELHAPVAVGDDLRHQRGVLGRDVVVGEVQHLAHPEDVLVVLDPLVHVAELDVADDVVDRQQPGVAALDVARRVAGHERALVSGAVDERVQRVAVGGDLRQAHRAVVVGEVVRLGRRRARRGSSPRGRRGRRPARRARSPSRRRRARRRGRRSRGPARARRSGRSGCGPARGRGRRGRARRSPARRRPPP